MALNVNLLKGAIKKVLEDSNKEIIKPENSSKSQEEKVKISIDFLAEGLANAIESFVESGEIITTVITKGSATTQSGDIKANIQ